MERHGGRRFLRVPQQDSREAFAAMEELAESARNAALQSRLLRALEQRRPFRHFKDVVENSAEGERWYRFREEREKQRALCWLAAEGIEPVERSKGSCT